MDGLKQVTEAGFNTAQMFLPLAPPGLEPGGKGGGSEEDTAAAALHREFREQTARVPLRYMLSAVKGRLPYSREELGAFAARAGAFRMRGDRLLCVYASDEPELAGISPGYLYGYQALLRRLFPGVPSAAPVIRAWQWSY